MKLVTAPEVSSSVERHLNRDKRTEHNQYRLLVTTRAFLDYLGLRDLADLPPLPSGDE